MAWRYLMRVARRAPCYTLFDRSPSTIRICFQVICCNSTWRVGSYPSLQICLKSAVSAGGASPYKICSLANRLFSPFRVVPPLFLFPFHLWLSVNDHAISLLKISSAHCLLFLHRVEFRLGMGVILSCVSCLCCFLCLGCSFYLISFPVPIHVVK